MINDRIDNEMIQVNTEMEEVLKSYDPIMQEVIDWVLSSKGKQLRARMLLCTAHYTNKKNSAYIYAAIVEIVHLASLVHDDIIDNARTRRGKLSVQAKFGPKMAVYAGDYMIFSIFTKLYKEADKKYSFIIESLNDVCYGELGQNRNLFNLNISCEDYLHNIYGKTATAFEIACKAGAVASGASQSEQNSFAEYGKSFGMLFQIRDDLLDLQLQDVNQEKPCFQDFLGGIYTLPILILLKNDSLKLTIESIISDYNKERITAEDVQIRLFTYLKENEWTEDFYAVTDTYYQNAVNSLASLGTCEVTEYLGNLLHSIYDDIHTFVSNIR